MIKSDKFWDKTAEKYSKKAVPDEEKYQNKLAETQAFLSEDMHVLEFGCGTGTTALHHAAAVRKIDAIDISQKMIEIARGKAAKAEINNVAFTLGTLKDFNAGACSFDAVLGLNVIHLVANRTELIAEVARILKPGGVFVSSTGCLGNSSFRFLKFIAPLFKLTGLIPDIFIVSEAQLADEIKNAGFSIERQWHHGPQGIDVFIIAKKL
ncbi:class I SAM-dependent methyltransferase [Amphritea sp. 1_MG-2023]|uniref:class I SAM-dependent methyltransferase n=1 Tax=Amphritea sp. 1_MG-2023 TaxID=3062670 RepID=UPI0026E23602|nr:class I SAM-dependent methyltransferase [Amphritea sp. 1_MG-2023]MDO6563168.1 class I SAM-dependent methyltransferase [Amphritea sp. 1_MG-2023]